MRIFGVVCLFMALVSATRALALYGEKDCFTKVYTKDAKIRKYDFKYTWGCSDTTSHGKESVSHATSECSKQGTTMGVDPGIWTGEFRTVSMITSSKKPCQFFGDASTKRAEFLTSHGDEIRRDIARGQGEHLRTVAVLSGCSDAALPRFYGQARQQFSRLNAALLNGDEAGAAFDRLIAADAELRQSCVMDRMAVAH